MSDRTRDLYNQNPFHEEDNQNMVSFTFSAAYDSPNVSFTDCLQTAMDYDSLAKAFGLSLPPSSSSRDFYSIEGDQNRLLELQLNVGNSCGYNEIPATPNSSVSTSSSEAAAAEDESSKTGKLDELLKGMVDEEESSKKVSKAKKKGEKSENEPRFAFMTKSEVDHLEDGYKWRKYGQKAVKNSPYPRSYYRCTSRNCLVKKRVERCFRDPSFVITTYEGQHNHPIPATVRGNYAHNSWAAPPRMAGPSYNYFPPNLVVPMLYANRAGAPQAASSPYSQPVLNDHGLLQDAVPANLFLKPEP